MNRITMHNFYKNHWIILIIVCVGVMLRLINFTEDLWLDEIWSMLTSGPDRNAMDIINDCKVDTHPPFFDLLLHYTILLFPNFDFAGRLLALILGVVGMISTYYYAKRISVNDKVAFIALVIITFSFFHIRYSGEGRFYTLLYLLSLMVTSHLFLFFKEKKTSHLFLFSLAGIVLTYTHYYGAILLFSLGLTILVMYASKQIESKYFWKFCGASIAILLLFVPWLPYLFDNNTTESWMSKPNVGYFFEYLYNYTGKNPLEFLFILFAFVMSLKMLKKDKVLFGILYGSIVLGFIIPLVVSSMTIPMLHYRYTFIYFPSIVLLTAIFWERTTIFKVKIKGVLYGLVICSMLLNFFFINDITRGVRNESWKDAAIRISDENVQEDVAVYCEQFFHFNYYLNRFDQEESQLPQDKLADRFWFLKTSYDKENYSFSGTHHVVETLDYKNKFSLYLYERTNID
ncbi:MAG: putative membrane protein [Patiriisocius sp.]|jgi:uncharacterized membrane protein